MVGYWLWTNEKKSLSFFISTVVCYSFVDTASFVISILIAWTLISWNPCDLWHVLKGGIWIVLFPLPLLQHLSNRTLKIYRIGKWVLKSLCLVEKEQLFLNVGAFSFSPPRLYNLHYFARIDVKWHKLTQSLRIMLDKCVSGTPSNIGDMLLFLSTRILYNNVNSNHFHIYLFVQKNVYLEEGNNEKAPYVFVTS